MFTGVDWACITLWALTSSFIKWITLVIYSSWLLLVGGYIREQENILSSNRKDLSEFDKGQIMMATRLNVRTSPKVQLLWGVPGLRWLVSFTSGPRKKQWWTCDRVMDDQGLLMHVGTGTIDDLWKLRLPKKFMLVMIERCQTTQTSVVVYRL